MQRNAVLIDDFSAVFLYAGTSSAAAETTSIFTFAATSETECSVRLSDKTATRAVVPNKATISGKDYTVTSVASNGFASARALETVLFQINSIFLLKTEFRTCVLAQKSRRLNGHNKRENALCCLL